MNTRFLLFWGTQSDILLYTTAISFYRDRPLRADFWRADKLECGSAAVAGRYRTRRPSRWTFKWVTTKRRFVPASVCSACSRCAADETSCRSDSESWKKIAVACQCDDNVWLGGARSVEPYFASGSWQTCRSRGKSRKTRKIHRAVAERNQHRRRLAECGHSEIPAAVAERGATATG